MMSKELVTSAKNDRPFPWRCTGCGARQVNPRATDYSTTINYDGRAYPVRVPDLRIPTCDNCGAQTFSVGDDQPILAALRGQLGLLSPEEIRQQRQQLELTQESLADRLGVSPETVAQWESGALLQFPAMDNLLRIFFSSSEARRLLEQRLVAASE